MLRKVTCHDLSALFRKSSDIDISFNRLFCNLNNLLQKIKEQLHELTLKHKKHMQDKLITSTICHML